MKGAVVAAKTMLIHSRVSGNPCSTLFFPRLIPDATLFSAGASCRVCTIKLVLSIVRNAAASLSRVDDRSARVSGCATAPEEEEEERLSQEGESCVGSSSSSGDSERRGRTERLLARVHV